MHAVHLRSSVESTYIFIRSSIVDFLAPQDTKTCVCQELVDDKGQEPDPIKGVLVTEMPDGSGTITTTELAR